MSVVNFFIGLIVAQRLARARRLARRADSTRDPLRYAKAAEAYRAVLALAPSRTDIRVQYGNTLKDSGRLTEAEAVYRVALIERSDDADIHLQLGRCLRLQDGQVGDTNHRVQKRDWTREAANAYNAALTLDPGMEDARQELLSIGSREWQLESVHSVPRSSQAAGMDIEQAREVTAELYEILLKRPPDPEGMEFHSRALATGELQILSMTRNLLASEEFGQNAARHASVARYFARTIITEMMARDPGLDALNAYSKALESGYALPHFLHEMLSSPEFRVRVDRSPEFRVRVDRPLVPFELGQLAEGLIAAHMTAEGCNVVFPPQASDGWPAVAEAQMRSMLHTLAMFAREALFASRTSPSPRQSASSTST